MAWNDVVGWIILGTGILWLVVFTAAWAVKRDSSLSFLAFFCIPFVPMSMVFFVIDNETPPDPNLIKIDKCIADGGDPEYTTNKYGEIVYYFGCIEGANR